MKNKYRVIIAGAIITLSILLLLFFKVFDVFGVESEKITGSSVQQSQDEENITTICVDPDFSKNFDDCNFWKETGNKTDTLIKLNDDSVESFCDELLRIFEKC